MKPSYWFDNDEERTIIDTDVTEISVYCTDAHYFEVGEKVMRRLKIKLRMV